MSDSEEEVEYEPEEFELDGISLSVTTIAYMPITKLLSCQTQHVEISGQKLWCGSLCLVSYFSKYPCDWGNTAIVELGAGTGVVSMVAYRLGSKCVIATDHDSKSIEHMHADKIRNNADVVVSKLDWYNPAMVEINHAIESFRPTAVRIVAGDVLYKAALLTPFFSTVHLLLSSFINADLLLCHVPRAGVEHGDVVRVAEEQGLRVVKLSDRVDREEVDGMFVPQEDMSSQLKSYCPEEDIVRARLYVISLH
ncbi:hypothetical protein EON65_37030 [archaeon]|nr:MAG: hypothetical protein EON65_37030 [archaeon]